MRFIFRYLPFTLLLLTTCIVNAQKTPKHKIGFITDNDLYVSTTLDRYYTNGLHIFYEQVKDSKYEIFTKKIQTFTIGQDIYNPFNTNVPSVFDQDRPYAGYLFANYKETLIMPKQFFRLGLEFGFTGDNSKAEWAQNLIHELYDIPESDGWETQIKERYNFGFLASYNRQLWMSKNSAFELSSITNVKAQTLFSKIDAGFGIRLGVLNESLAAFSQSLFYKNDLTHTTETWVKECFIGFKSYFTYQLDDYTVTGDLSENNLQKQFTLTPWVWHNDIGFYWNLKHWNISYHQIFHTNNVKTIAQDWVRYGSIQLAYKF